MIAKKFLLLCCVTTSIFAHDVAEQTFFMTRPFSLDTIHQNALSRYRINHAWYEQKEYDAPRKKAAANCNVTFIYSESDNGCGLARYFLPCERKAANTACFGNCTSGCPCDSFATRDIMTRASCGNSSCTGNCGLSSCSGNCPTNTCESSCPSKCTNQLLVDEQGNGDIGSGWIGLFGQTGEFQGLFSIKPKHKVFGALLQYHHDLSEFIDGAWIEALLPVVNVRHDLNFKECNNGNVTTASFDSIAASLNNPEWCFGKWSCRSRSRSGIDDLLMKVGYGFFRYKRFRLDGFLSFLVPLGDKPASEFIFEPIVGAGDHFGLGGGINLEAEFVSTRSINLSWFVDAQYRYLFSNDERRSFDIKDKTFSRYLNFNQETIPPLPKPGNFPEDFVSPGINFFTAPVKVRPGSSFDFLTFLHANVSFANFEFGYRYWWRESERVCLERCWPHKIGIVANVSQDANRFFPGAQICNKWESDPTLLNPPQSDVFVEIKQEDLNLSVASHKTVHTHTIFGAFSANGRFLHHPAMIGLGASYEFAERNTAFDLWSVWGSVSIGF